MLKTGWTPNCAPQQFEWFLKAANYRGGASFEKFIEFIRNDAVATFTTPRKPRSSPSSSPRSPRSNPPLEERRRHVRRPHAARCGRSTSSAPPPQTGLKGRNFDNGRKMFGAAACFACHRFGNEGGMTGPDLTGAGGRYTPHDLLDQIINPSKEINEQFAPIIVTKNNGETLTGVVVNLNGDSVTLNTDLTDPNQRVNVDRKEVKSIEPSPISPMPPMLLDLLTKDEILDLLAYVLSGGDKSHAMFK